MPRGGMFGGMGPRGPWFMPGPGAFIRGSNPRGGGWLPNMPGPRMPGPSRPRLRRRRSSYTCSAVWHKRVSRVSPTLQCCAER